MAVLPVSGQGHLVWGGPLAGRVDRVAVVANSWPEEVVADPVVDRVRLIALNLRSVIGERSLRTVAVEAGVDHTAVFDLLAGNTWPQVATVVRLEAALEVELWPPLRS